jgi:predicted  nucleic acid-binding Zn-ribbon protein
LGSISAKGFKNPVLILKSINYKEHPMKTKDEYIEKLATELKSWSAEIDVLNTKLETAAADVKAKYHEEIAALKDKERVAEEKIKELQASTSDAWETVKETADTVWHDLKTGLAGMVDKFK